MYSQHDEEKIILAHTPLSGRLLDLGAYNALAFSNSRALIERGWSAVLVEPSAVPFAGLVEAYKTNDKITLMNCFAGSAWGLKKIYMTPDALTTGDEANYQKWKAVGQFREVIVPEVPLIQILLTAGQFDFLNIDCEGVSWELLKQINLKQFGCSLVCCEYDNHKEEMRAWFEQHGFKVISENGGNLIAKRV
jgi:FkbM family methyltransferase